jgi:hypothetical protein
MVCRGEGFAYKTRGTGHAWWDLESWTKAAWSILEGEETANTFRVMIRHLDALDLRKIRGADSEAALQDVLAFLRSPALSHLAATTGRIRLDLPIGDVSIAAKSRIHQLRCAA